MAEDQTLDHLRKRETQLETELAQIHAMIPKYEGALGECRLMINNVIEQQAAKEEKPKVVEKDKKKKKSNATTTP